MAGYGIKIMHMHMHSDTRHTKDMMIFSEGSMIEQLFFFNPFPYHFLKQKKLHGLIGNQSSKVPHWLGRLHLVAAAGAALTTGELHRGLSVL